jgi:hypothetical protein
MAFKWQRKLGQRRIYQLENELMRLVNVDAVFSYEAKQLAIQYVRRRLAELQGWSKKRASLAAVAWFFNFEIPVGARLVAPGPRPGYVTRSWRRSAANVNRKWAW